MSKYIKNGLGFFVGFSLGLYDRRNNTFLIFAKTNKDLQEKIAKAEEVAVNEYKNLQNKLSGKSNNKDKLMEEFENSEWGEKAKTTYQAAKKEWIKTKDSEKLLEEFAEQAKNMFENSEWGQKATQDYNKDMRQWLQNIGYKGNDDISDHTNDVVCRLKKEFEKTDTGKRAKELLEIERKNWIADKLNIGTSRDKMFDSKTDQNENIQTKFNNTYQDLSELANKTWESIKEAKQNISNEINENQDERMNNTTQSFNDDQYERNRSNNSDVLKKHKQTEQPFKSIKGQGNSSEKNLKENKNDNQIAQEENKFEELLREGKKQFYNITEAINDNKPVKLNKGISEEEKEKLNTTNDKSKYKNVSTYKYNQEKDDKIDLNQVWERTKDIAESSFEKINESQPIEYLKETIEKYTTGNRGLDSEKYQDIDKRSRKKDEELSKLWQKTKEDLGEVIQTVADSEPMKVVKDTMEEKGAQIFGSEHKSKEEESVDNNLKKNYNKVSKQSANGIETKQKNNNGSKTQNQSSNQQQNIRRQIDIDHHLWTPGFKKQQATIFNDSSKVDTESSTSNGVKSKKQQNIYNGTDKKTGNFVSIDDTKDTKDGDSAYNKPDKWERAEEGTGLYVRNLNEKAPYNTDAHTINIKEKPIPKSGSPVNDHKNRRDNVNNNFNPNNYSLDKERDRSFNVQNKDFRNEQQAYTTKDSVLDYNKTKDKQNIKYNDNPTDVDKQTSEKTSNPKVVK